MGDVSNHSIHHSTHHAPVRITDTTLRDGHQSLWATRMRTSDISGILDVIDSVGYYSLEVWGGATFDVCLRFLRENPWERLRQIKRKAQKTPLQMLLRGQNVVGYKNYPDDVLDRFIALACENGIDIFRIFDALNDNRNIESAIKFVKKHGGHAQGTLCYTISPVHTVEKFVEIAKEQVELGIDSICIKDMAGILSPTAAEKLVSALVKNVSVPIQIHSHATSGMAPASYLAGINAGAGAIDCAISSMAGFSSQPPVETMISMLEETCYATNLDKDALRKICKYFEDLAPQRMPSHHPSNIIDPEILIHHIPGGMISNLRSQLEQQGALDKLPEVLQELPRVRADMGYPPLVTPTSQIVGVQAVMNILAGERYAMVPQETRNYVKGLYGRPPAPIDPTIAKKILGDEVPISCRPADLIKPMLEETRKNAPADLVQTEEDLISYCLFPEQALEFFKWRRTPEKDRPRPPADIELENKKTTKTPSGILEKPVLERTDYDALHSLIDRIVELRISEMIIKREDISITLKGKNVEITASPSSNIPQTVNTKEITQNDGKAIDSDEQKGETIVAPLNGTFYISSAPDKPPFVKEGDIVKEGEPVCIVEAMKLFNQIKSPCNCKIIKIIGQHGKQVKKGDVLLFYEPSK